MKDILILVSPSRNQNYQAYIAIQKEILKHDKKTKRLLYTSFLLTGPKSFQNAMSIVNIADQHGLDTAIFEVESVLKHPVEISKDFQNL